MFVLLFIQPFDAYSATPEELYRDGNSAYSKSEYKRAFDLYSEALASGAMDPALYYNLGNASYKTGRPGLAILYYKKGLRLAPSDKKMRENLAFVGLAIKDRIDEPKKGVVTSFLSWCFTLMTLNGFFSMTLLLYLLFFLLVILIIRGKKNLSRLVFFTSSFFLVFALFLFAKIYDEQLTVSGVVLSEELHARSEPKQDGELVFTIHEGTSLEVTEEQGEWFLVTIPTGWSGWVKREGVGII